MNIAEMSDDLQHLVDKVSGSDTLSERLGKIGKMIGLMCNERRPPKMSIPVQWYDEDFFITTTANEAQKRIVAIEAQLAEAQRHNELLRAVAEAAKVFGNKAVLFPGYYTLSFQHGDKLILATQAAIDGGALGCQHENAVNAKNQVIQSGWHCPDCDGIFADDPRGGALEP